MKICNKCGVSREVSEYKRDPRNKNGLNGICNVCIKERTKELRAARNAGLIELKVVSEKTCGSCNETKPIDNFYKDAGMADGYRTTCKPCKDSVSVEWRKQNRKHVAKVAREYRAIPENYLRARLQRYGLTPDQYRQMIKDQDNKCKICLRSPPKNKELVVDHDKVTGKVRGLLCYTCNRDLHILDNPEKLQKALDYIKKSKI